MPRKKSFSNYDKASSWLDGNIILSLGLFLCTYTVLGWSIAGIVEHWSVIIHEQTIGIQLLIEEKALLLVTKLLILGITVVFSLFLSSPIALMTFIFEESINSDLKAFLAILTWSIVLVFIFCSIDYFADILVIASANMLIRLDLQKFRFKTWQIFFIIFILAFIGFIFGVLLFSFFAN